MEKKIFIVIISVLLGVYVLSGCSTDKSVVTGDIQTTDGENNGAVYFMAGKIEANNKVDVTSKIAARVAKINVGIGSIVKEGDVIIELDSKDLEAQVAQAQAGVNTAHANLTKAQNGARPEEISQAQSALESAETNYENSKNTYMRNQQLFKDGAISKSQLEQSQNSLVKSEASYKSAKETLNMLNKGETKETIEVLQSQLKEAQAALEFARTQLDNGTIVSPISGVISVKNINTGELAVTGVPLITVVNLETMIVNAYIPSGLISKIKTGQEVVIKVSEIPDKEFNGEISVIDSVIDSKSKNVLVKVKFKEQSPLLKPGMFAEIGLKN